MLCTYIVLTVFLFSYQKHLSMKFAETQYQAIDFTKPLYPTAALYTACRYVLYMYIYIYTYSIINTSQAVEDSL